MGLSSLKKNFIIIQPMPIKKGTTIILSHYGGDHFGNYKRFICISGNQD